MQSALTLKKVGTMSKCLMILQTQLEAQYFLEKWQRNYIFEGRKGYFSQQHENEQNCHVSAHVKTL
jgi:hypothetical protein